MFKDKSTKEEKEQKRGRKDGWEEKKEDREIERKEEEKVKEKETPVRGALKGTSHAQFRKGSEWKCKLESLFSLQGCRPQSIWSH